MEVECSVSQMDTFTTFNTVNKADAGRQHIQMVKITTDNGETRNTTDTECSVLGDFQYGKQSGRGEARYRDFKVYDGEWRNGKYHGQGSCYWPNGDSYEGEWLRGMKNGVGKFESTDGSIYTGYFKDGEQSGRGRARYPNDDVYYGEWKNGKRHGKGRLSIMKSRDNLVAQWSFGKRNGDAIHTTIDFKISKGQYKDDKKDGFWTFTRSGDMDRYDNGKLVEVSPKLVDGYLHQNERAYRNLNFPNDLYRLFKDYAVHESKPKSV
eukprot:544107_1